MESLTDEDPRSVGGYELRARLGQGGFGKVYLGLSPGGRAVAVKVLRPELGEDREFLRRFRLEVAAAQRVNGIYTAQVVSAGLNERRPWVATAFVPGPSLERAVAVNGPLPELAVWRLLAGLVEALQAIHACGLVHRDLKPANVLLAADGPRVIDFGISKSLDGTAMTATGMIIGTPSFMAPEQADGGIVGPESDVFSLGCVLAYAATGALPFGSGNHLSILYRIVHKDPALDGIPAQLRAVIEECLAKAPAARPGLAELAKIGRDGPAGVSSPSPVAFWPPSIAQLIRQHEGQLDHAQLADEQGQPELLSSAPSPAVQASPGYLAPESAYRPTGSLPRPAAHSATYPSLPLAGDGVRPDQTAPSSPAPATVRPRAAAGYPGASADAAVARRRGRRRLPVVIAGLVVLAVVAAAAIVLNLRGGTTVPQVNSDSQAQAVQQIDAAGLKSVLVRRIDPQLASGLVISTKPASGSSVKKGQTVTVYLSAGPAVPAVSGLTWPQALARLKAAGFAPVEHPQASAAVKAGVVIGTQPASGGIVPANGQVTVDVSTGPASLTLPNVAGIQSAKARAQLLGLGFTNVKVVTDASSTATKGVVDHLTPVPGQYPPGQQITLYASAGGIAVPNVVNQTGAEAVAILQQDGFTVETDQVAAPSSQLVEPGTVYSQSPAAGRAEPKGTVIEIFVEPEASSTASPTPTNPFLGGF